MLFAVIIVINLPLLTANADTSNLFLNRRAQTANVASSSQVSSLTDRRRSIIESPDEGSSLNENSSAIDLSSFPSFNANITPVFVVSAQVCNDKNAIAYKLHASGDNLTYSIIHGT